MNPESLLELASAVQWQKEEGGRKHGGFYDFLKND